jgi:uncharacterized protein (TIGR02246 family)
MMVVIVAGVVMAGVARLVAQSGDSEIRAFFTAYDAAFNARDIDKLGTMYHPDLTVFEGGGVDRTWASYRDGHLGPELERFQNLEWGHSDLEIHMLGDAAAYVTANYRIKYTMGERDVDSMGIATHVLVKEAGAWRIRHSQTASRRPARRGGGR